MKIRTTKISMEEIKRNEDLFAAKKIQDFPKETLEKMLSFVSAEQEILNCIIRSDSKTRRFQLVDGSMYIHIFEDSKYLGRIHMLDIIASMLRMKYLS